VASEIRFLNLDMAIEIGVNWCRFEDKVILSTNIHELSRIKKTKFSLLITGKNVSSPSAKEIFSFDNGQKWFIDCGEAKFGEGRNGRFGSGGFGSMRFAMKRIGGGTWIIFIIIPSNMG
jgi:hypothetical protein